MEPMNTESCLVKEAAKDYIALSYHAYLHWNKSLALTLTHALCYLKHVFIAFHFIDYTIVFFFFSWFSKSVEHYLIVFIILNNGLNKIFTFALCALSMNVSPFETKRFDNSLLDVAVAF